MIQIITLSNGISINGNTYPNDSLIFSIKNNTNISISLVGDGTNLFTANYREFIDSDSNLYDTPQEVIDTLLLNNPQSSQAALDQEIQDREAADSVLDLKITALENNEYKITYWQAISANSGTITKPTNSTIILDSFIQGVDALVETIVNGQPSGLSPVTGGGAYVTVSSFDSSDNYVLSGTPSNFPVALLYIIKIDAKDYQNVNSDFIVTAEPVKEVVQTILEGDLNHSPSSDAVYNALQEYNTLFVETNPGPGEFATIDEALATILTSSPTNYFKVQIGVGEFVKGSQPIPSYVSIAGASIQTTTIVPDGNNHVFELNNPAIELSFFTIANAPVGKAGIFDNDSGNYTQIHKVSFSDCDINIYCLSATRDCLFFAEYIDFNGTYSIGVKVESGGGFLSYANLENYYNLPTGGAPIGTYITGQNAEVSVLASGQNGFGTGISFYQEDGCRLQITSTDITAWDTAIKIANVGAASQIIVAGVTCLDSTSWDLDIEHPVAFGTIQGAFDENKLTNDGAVQGPIPSTIGLLIQSTANNSITVNGEINGVFGDVITDVSQLIIQGGGMGILEGGVLSDGGGLDVSVLAGNGYLMKTNGVLVKLIWNIQTLTIPDNSQGYVYFNENSILTFNSSQPSLTSSILLGKVGTRSGSFEFISNTAVNALHISNRFGSLFRSGFGSVYTSGSIISENVTPFHLNISAGTYFFSSNQINLVGGANITFNQYYNTGGSTFNVSSTNVLNHTQYNTGGALVTLTAGYYAKHSVYTVGEGVGEKYFVVIAQAEYSTLLAVQQATLPLPPSYFTGEVVLISSIIIQQGAANIIQILDNRPILGSIPTGVSASADHTSLLNLNTGNAGHNQFIMLNGSTPMSGDLDLGGNNAVNGGTYNGVTVETHAARHDFNGADPLLTGVPSTIGSVNAEGVNNTHVARLDHIHAHGNQAGGSTHSAVTTSVDGFMIASDKTKLDAITGTNTGDVTLTGTPTYITIAGQVITRNAVSLTTDITGTLSIANGGTNAITANTALNNLLPSQATNAGKVLTTDGTNSSWSINGNGTVTSVAISGANGIGVSSSPITTNGAIALSLGAITPSSVASTGAVTGTNLSGTNTGDNATNSQYSGLVSNATHTGDATGATALTLATVNSNIGTFGSASKTVTTTVNAKGLTTAISEQNIAIAESQVTNLVSDLAGKQSTLVSGTNIKTVNGTTLLGSGNLSVGDALAANPLSQFASTTSAQLAGVVSDETGTGALVFSNSPTFVTPNIGNASGNITGNAATVTTNANLTGAITSIGNTSSLGSFTSAQLATALTDETGTGASVFANAPTLIAPNLGTPASLVLTNATGLPFSTGVTGKPTTTVGYGITDAELTANKGVANGYAALSSLFQLQLPNQAGTTINLLTNTTTSGRIWTLPNATGAIALTSNLLSHPYIAQTANYTLTATDNVVNCTSGTFTITLPTAVGITGQFFSIKNSGTGIITIATTSSQTIDGGTTATIYQNSSITALSNGVNWIILEYNYNSNRVYCYDTTNQTCAIANTFQDILFNTNVILQGWSHTASTASFTCNETGVYLIEYDAGANATGGAALSVELRVLKNAVEIPGSQIYQEVNNNNIQQSCSGQIISQFNATDILKLQLTSTKTSGQIQSGVGSSTTKPSVKLTILRIA